MKKQRILIVFCILLILVTGCGAQKEKEEAASVEIFAMDTEMKITAYGGEAEALEACEKVIRDREVLFSVTEAGSDIYKINHHQTHQVAEETAVLIEKALSVGAETKGAFDISIYPVLKAWGFTTEAYTILSEERLAELLPTVDYRKVSLSGNQVSLPEGMEIDLGGIAKGDTGDAIAKTLREKGVASALINLGGNVQCVGSKTDGSPWRVAVQDPKGDGLVGAINIRNQAVVTSGGYERYFVGEDGKTYWHILDPATGKPAQTGILSATIVGDEGALCDALSTSLFVMGEDKAADYWRTSGGFDYMLVTEDGRVIASEGIADAVTLMDAYANTSITVVKR